MDIDIFSAVRKCLETHKSLFENKAVLLAVSGGADSIALLSIIHELSSVYKITPIVVTVNHNIRPAEESLSDAVFVQTYCKNLMPPVECIKIDIPSGEINSYSRTRDRGIEEAARFVRYNHLEVVRKQFGASCILTGHTRDDQLETLLMRLLKGFGSLRGIAEKRNYIVRPLLDVSRKTIEAWLHEKEISWVEDSTNKDLSYVRNKFRKVLIPFLDVHLQGWQSSILSVSESMQEDEDFILQSLTLQWHALEKGICCDAQAFDLLHTALQKRFLAKGFALLGMKKRISRRIFNIFPQFRGTLTVGEFIFTFRDEKYIFEPIVEKNNPRGYCIFVYSSCAIKVSFGSILVETREKKMYITVSGLVGSGRSSVCSIELNNQPCIIRSRKSGDVIAMPNGKRKTLKKIFNDWSVPPFERALIPVIEQQGCVLAVCGSVLGYNDWIVNHKEL